MNPDPGHEDLQIRLLDSYDELEACSKLQCETWGATDVVAPTLLQASRKIGAIVAGAFDSQGDLIGSVYGMSGPFGGEVVHWSHMLAVRPSWRNRGVGAKLKVFQAQVARSMTLSRMYWTFDPLEARNAHFNLVRLGARVDSYTRDLYGSGEDNELHRGLGTDRFTVMWDLEQLEDGADPMDLKELDLTSCPTITASLQSEEADDDPSIVEARYVAVEIPLDIQALKSEHPRRAVRWRERTRFAFEAYFERGYRVVSFHRDDEASRRLYVLEAPATSTTPAQGDVQP